MRTKHFLISVLSVFFLVSTNGYKGYSAEGDEKKLAITQYTLDNGLTVILNQDNSRPEVFGVVAVRAGGKNDPADATGLAHYMEHMLFKGTQKLGTRDWEKEKPHIDRIFELYEQLAQAPTPEEKERIQLLINEESHKASEYAIPNELSNLINSMGGTRLNAGTGPDYTIYYNKFPASQIYKWIDLYAHRFLNPVFRSFQAELEVVYEEKNMYSDQFQSRLFEEFQKYFFKNHPYGQQPLIGTIEHLKNPSLKRMFEFYQNYYVANNMVLVLAGDFNPDEVKPLIEEKFGVWPTAEVPEQKVYSEEPFNGRELIEARLSPIKLGLVGYRTITQSHEDYIPLEVAMSLLNNQNQTGLLDKLMIDGKVLAAQMLALPYNDHGAGIVLFVPKIVGQKLPEAEELVLNEVKRLAKGDFEDWMIEAVKQRMYIDHQKSLESIENRATMLAGAYTSGQDIDDILDYPNKVMAVTKEDIIRVAGKYFGENYLVLHSKMGFPKKEKIDKPGFKPLQSNTNAKSEYAQHFETLPSRRAHIIPIDFSKDVTTQKISNGVSLKHVNNSVNDIFTMLIKYEAGNHHIDMLEYATMLMDMAGTANKKVDEVKKAFAKIGCSYSIWSDDSYTFVEVEGIEENLPLAIELLNELLTVPVIDQDKVKIVYDNEKTGRKIERSEPDNVASALFDYMLYAEKSKSLDRLTLKEVKNLNADDLTSAFVKATQHTATIHYVGKLNPEMVQTLISTGLTFAPAPLEVETPVVMPTREFAENSIFFVNKKKARQSKVFLFANGDSYDKSIDPYMNAFNEYFGGGFSGLVLQEIREYRSLAYGAGGGFRKPPVKGKPFSFRGYLSTQADKSLIAIETYDSLIREMPQKPERMDMIKNYLVLSAETNRPNFRNLSQTVDYWKRIGYKTDPFLTLQPAYNELTWENLIDFYNKHMATKPVAIAIVGDKRKIDLKELSQYGTIIKVKEKALFSK